MRIGINALSITPHSTGGGTTYIIELLNHLSQIDNRNKYILFIRNDSKHHFDEYVELRKSSIKLLKKVLSKFAGAFSKSSIPEPEDNLKYFAIPVPSKFSVAFRILIEHLLMPLLVWLFKLDVLFCPGDSIPLLCPCLRIMVIQNLLYFHFQETSTLLHRKKRKFYVRAQVWYYNYITRRSALKSDKIITVSENARKEIMEYFRIGSSKISVVYHGLGSHFKMVDQQLTGDIIESYKLKPGYILYVGAVLPHKNIETMIYALSILKKRYCITSQLVIAGSDHAGYSSYLRSIGSKSGVFEQITFLGHIPYKELPHLYRGASLFVMLSLCESFGLPVLEAMACGCPVVCSNASSLPEIADDAAVLVDPNDPLKVADAIRSILADEEFRRRMIDLGIGRAKEFSWNKAASQTISIIEQVVKNSARC